MINRKLVLAARPISLIKNSDFRLVEEEVPSLTEGELLIQTHYLSLAPVMKFYMSDGAGIENKLQFGETMRGRGVGQVVASKNEAFQIGDYVHGKFGWQEYVISTASDYDMIYKVSQTSLPISTSLGILGITGYTSYFGLYEVGELKQGDNVLVSAAAGGVGSTVAGLAKIKGANVIGMTSTDEKKKLLTSHLSYDHAINYKTENIGEKIDEYFPDGVDVYFDNVGGEILDLVLTKINQYARVVCCGRISTYKDSLSEQNYHLKNWHRIGGQRARMQGFFIYDYKDRFPEAENYMSQWIEQGKLMYQEDIVEGLENMPQALNRLFEGKNVGKQIVKVLIS